MKKYSIMICTYNGEAYLDKVIESIYSQKNIDSLIEKVLIVDNASHDKTKDIIMRYMEKYKNLNYIYEKNPGLANARKHIVSIDTEWCILLDDDNILLENFIMNLDNFIQSNPNLGVVNSNSIAYPDFNVTQKESDLIRALLSSLACTHYCIDEVKSHKAALNCPFGAGMTIRVGPIKKYAEQQWLVNTGRKQGSLTSGEDGELARIVLKEGYIHKLNKESSFYHIIPKFRIQPQYVKKLKKGLVEGSYVFISTDNKYIIKRLKMLVRKIFNIILFPIRYLKAKEKYKKIYLKLTLIDAFNMIGYILKDFIVIRKFD